MRAFYNLIKVIKILQHEEILRHYAKLLDECKTARLTGTRGADEIFKLQIMDCVPSIEFLPISGKIIDVGSGGGLPGIIWAVMRPDLKIILLDSIQKKCLAMQNIIDALEIKNVNIICSRSEDFLKEHSEKFDLAGARAVGNIKLTLELLTPLVKTGGRIMTFKGAKLNEELSEFKNYNWNKHGLSEPEIKFYDENSSRCIVLWQKLKTYKRRH